MLGNIVRGTGIEVADIENKESYLDLPPRCALVPIILLVKEVK